MTITFQPPPTYAPPVITDEKTGKASFNPIWLNWFLSFAQLLEEAASGSTADHNNLLNIQGGTTGQYYHFTSAEHTKLVAYNHEALAGLLGGAANDHYHLTAAQQAIAVAYTHNTLNSLQGGTAGEYYHLTSAQQATATGGPATAVTAITVPASGSAWQNTTGFNVLVIPAGGTTPTYDLSRDNITYYPIGTPTVITVVRGDYLKFTYAVAPTAVYFAM